MIKDPNTFTKFSDGVEKAGTYNANVESLVTFAASYSSDQIPALVIFIHLHHITLLII